MINYRHHCASMCKSDWPRSRLDTVFIGRILRSLDAGLRLSLASVCYGQCSESEPGKSHAPACPPSASVHTLKPARFIHDQFQQAEAFGSGGSGKRLEG